MTVESSVPANDPEAFIKKAKTLVKETFNNNFPVDDVTIQARDEHFYVVWFAKTLGNWKALVSTDLISGQYWEVTHNGAKAETYVDHYVKAENRCFSDSSYAAVS
jgi:hypothetical protein